jgi:hypothetical protein
VPTVLESSIESYKTLTTKNEDEVACMLADGPVTAAIYVNTSLLRYSGGIYDDAESCQPHMVLNHVVLLGCDFLKCYIVSFL